MVPMHLKGGLKMTRLAQMKIRFPTALTHLKPGLRTTRLVLSKLLPVTKKTKKKMSLQRQLLLYLCLHQPSRRRRLLHSARTLRSSTRTTLAATAMCHRSSWVWLCMLTPLASLVVPLVPELDGDLRVWCQEYQSYCTPLH